MTKARDLANAADVLDDVSATELSYVNGVTSAIQTQLDAKVAKSLVDAKGDLLVGSANDTVSRLAVASTAGYLLTVDSAETTGLKWAAPAAAGGETLITTTEADNTASQYTFSSLGSYKHLRFVITKLQTTGSDNRALGFQVNGDTGGNYTNLYGRNGIGETEFNSNGIVFAYSADGSARYGFFVLDIYNYSSSTEYKAFRWWSGAYTNGSPYSNYMFGHWNSTNAITSIKFFSGSNIKLGTFKVYGVS